MHPFSNFLLVELDLANCHKQTNQPHLASEVYQKSALQLILHLKT